MKRNKIRLFNKIIVITLGIITIVVSSCSNKLNSIDDVVGIYGENGWSVKLEKGINLEKYFPNIIPSELVTEKNNGSYDGLVYMEKSTGERGIGLWKFLEKVKNEDQLIIYIFWQNYNDSLKFYGDGNFSIINHDGSIYLIVGEKWSDLVGQFKKRQN